MSLPERMVGLMALFACLAAAPASSATTVDVDWTKPTGTQGAATKYGLDLFQIYSPSVSQQNPTYKSELARMAPGLVRIHSWEMMADSSTANGWITNGAAANYAWDETKILAALAGVIPPGTAVIMNIPAWPSFLGDNSAPLPAANGPAFAAFCADLVRIVNVKGQHAVTYWEITNERDSAYDGKGAELAAVVLQAAHAMKLADPSIKVGGPAFTQPWVSIVDDFLTASVGELDFISYHTYATGDANAPLQGLFDSAAGWADIAASMQARIAAHTARKLELFHDEYNISYNPPDVRMNGPESAVFDALALIGFAKADIAGSAAWNEADGWYGKLDSNLNPRPASYVFELFNHTAIGDVVQASTDAPQDVVPLAVLGQAGKSLFLVNRTTNNVALTLNGFADRSAQASQVTSAGMAQVTLPAAGMITLPGLSVTLAISGSGARPPQAGLGGTGGVSTGGGGASFDSGGSTALSSGGGGGSGGTATSGGRVGGSSGGALNLGVGGTPSGNQLTSGSGGSTVIKRERASSGCGCQLSPTGERGTIPILGLLLGFAIGLVRRRFAV